MKLPEPVGWSYLFEDDGSLCQQFDTREEADRWVDSPDCLWAGYVSPLYSESQVKELLAQADSMLIAHMNGADQMRKRYESVLKQAMEALEYANPLMECYWGNNASEAITEIKKVLG